MLVTSISEPGNGNTHPRGDLLLKPLSLQVAQLLGARALDAVRWRHVGSLGSVVEYVRHYLFFKQIL